MDSERITSFVYHKAVPNVAQYDNRVIIPGYLFMSHTHKQREDALWFRALTCSFCAGRDESTPLLLFFRDLVEKGSIGGISLAGTVDGSLVQEKHMSLGIE